MRLADALGCFIGINRRGNSAAVHLDYAMERLEPRHSLELGLPYRLKGDAASDDEVADRGRDQQLSRAGCREHPSADVSCDASRAPINPFQLAGVCSGPNVEADDLGFACEMHCGAHRIGRALKRREEAIPSGVLFVTTVHLQLPANQPAEVGQDLAPTTVADKGRHARRVDDIDEQHGRHTSTGPAACHDPRVRVSLPVRQESSPGCRQENGGRVGDSTAGTGPAAHSANRYVGDGSGQRALRARMQA